MKYELFQKRTKMDSIKENGKITDYFFNERICRKYVFYHSRHFIIKFTPWNCN